MRPELFVEMAAIQQTHWWFVARREILAAVIGRMGLAPQASILEIGCGTGANLAMLRQQGKLQAMEYDPVAREMAGRLGICPVLAGGLPEPVVFEDGSFDLVCLLDVLEHIGDDEAALARAARLLKPGGSILLTVPAYRWLWSAHDTAHEHRRRYTVAMLMRQARQAGLEVRRAGYFNTLLFPLIAGVRLLGKCLLRPGQSDATLPSPWLNRLLAGIFALERHWVARRGFPFGTSVIAVLDLRS